MAYFYTTMLPHGLAADQSSADAEWYDPLKRSNCADAQELGAYGNRRANPPQGMGQVRCQNVQPKNIKVMTTGPAGPIRYETVGQGFRLKTLY